MHPTEIQQPLAPGYDSQIGACLGALDRRWNDLKSLRDFYERTLTKINIEMQCVGEAINLMETGLKQTQAMETAMNTSNSSCLASNVSALARKE